MGGSHGDGLRFISHHEMLGQDVEVRLGYCFVVQKLCMMLSDCSASTTCPTRQQYMNYFQKG